MKSVHPLIVLIKPVSPVHKCFVHFIGRRKSRDWWRHLAVPVIGFAILLYVIINAQVAAQRLGFVWLGVGVAILVCLMVTGREPELRAEEEL